MNLELRLLMLSEAELLVLDLFSLVKMLTYMMQLSCEPTAQLRLSRPVFDVSNQKLLLHDDVEKITCDN